MNKFHKELFFATSNKVIWPQKNFNCMHGLKSAILTIFVLGDNEYLERLESKIRKCLLFMLNYSKITVCLGSCLNKCY